MNPKWSRLAGDLLELASQEFSNHVCNDRGWPADWTPEDRREFAEAMVADNANTAVTNFIAVEREYVDDLCRTGPPDWWVMVFLAKQLRKDSEDRP